MNDQKRALIEELFLMAMEERLVEELRKHYPQTDEDEYDNG